METILKTEKLCRRFSDKDGENRVLENISFSVEKGEFVSVMGPSGSGKSTLLFCVSGMDKPSEGSVELCGCELSQLNDDELSQMRRSRLGFVFQQPSLLKNLSVIDNIMLVALRENGGDRKAIEDRALSLMRKAGIEELAGRNIESLSGGQLQRAGICRALMCAPEMLFADEPTGALNSGSAQDIMKLFLRINEEGTGILLVTHDAKIAAQSERVVFMLDGKIADELRLGKYRQEDLDERTARINEKIRSLGI